MSTTSPSLESFVRKLLDEKGLEGLDDEVKEQVYRDLLDRVEDRINAAILAQLPPEQLAAFEEVLDAGDADAVQAFCQAQVPELDEVVAKELMAFRQTYLGS